MYVEKFRRGKDSVSAQLHELQQEVKRIEKMKLNTQDKMLGLKGEIDKAQYIAERDRRNCKSRLMEYLSGDDTQTGRILDIAFIEEILSKNNEVSTKAQITNPWSTEEFNREREKLFYLALQMTKEFVLSSKSCRANLCILGQYWGLKTENGTDKIKFDKQDSEAMI